MKKENTRTVLFLGLIGLAMITRFIPHAPNFTAVGAAALFGGVIFKDNWKAFMAPLLAMFLSDLLLNNVVYAQYQEGFSLFTQGFLFIYAAIFLTSLIARAAIKGKHRGLKVLGAGVSSALVFYLLTNFGAWLANPLYSQDLAGLMLSYAAGLPFLANSLASTLLYSAILFGAAYLISPAYNKGMARA